MSTMQLPADSACIQSAIQKAIQLSTPALKNHLDALKVGQWMEDISDDLLERTYHAGELALEQCFLKHMCQFPRAELPCGYFPTMKVQIFSARTLALIVSHSDLDIEVVSDRAGAELIRIIFGLLFHRVEVHRLQRSFDDLFHLIIQSTHAAFISHVAQKALGNKLHRRRRTRADGGSEHFKAARHLLKLIPPCPPASGATQAIGPVIQARSVTTVKDLATREVDEFLDIAKKFPAAFITGFKAGLSSPDPLKASRIRYFSPSSSLSVLATPRRFSKPYLRASAPSPPSPERRIHHSNRLRTATLRQDLPSSSSNLPPIPRRRIHTLSTPPAFSPFGPNRSLIFNPKPGSRI
ncbi:hypothetical protein MSAN_00403100 [Mycena sanguinolenta]|uniref:Uncharacterized protein n=1 Tax=Mycena sanguinolenta TaxID=230812 RepID=A0A8H6Z9U9_9AGAR|nr:hypothetical protein MSAN_00403100 [Mycena sanguinolenta]